MTTKRKIPVFSVGLFLLGGLSVLGWMIIKYGATNKIQEGYTVTVEFSDASGIIEGGIVRLAGANVGFIPEAPQLVENRKVVVPVTIRQDLTLPKNTKFEIVSLSLLGDKAIYLNIPDDPSDELIQDGDHIVGKSPEGLGEVTTKAEAFIEESQEALEEYRGVAQKLNVTLDRLNNTLLQEDRLAKVGLALDNVADASSSIKEASKSFKELADGLQPLADDTRVTLAEFRKAAKGANEAMEGVNSTLEATEDTVIEAKVTFAKVNTSIEKLDPTLKSLPETLETYNRVGKNLEKSLSSEDSLLSTMTKDKEVKDDAKSFVKNLRTNGILGYKDNTDPEEDDPRDRYRGLRR